MQARDNPFAASRVLDIRFRPQRGSWPELLDRLRQLDYRTAIVGPEGSGKTTLWEDLQVRLAELGYPQRAVRLALGQRAVPHDQQPRLDRLSTAHIVFVDGAEQLSWWNWRRMLSTCRTARGLIITSHRAGLLPTLIQTTTSQDLLAEIIRELTQRATADCERAAATLFRKHRGNLRDCLREMYDYCARDEWPRGGMTP